MYLKNLTVLGFKSFADKTSLNFQRGITAIVGPNGCGKSNVADAIRWVLGEQSAKALRGGEMADVIFNGTDGRKPLSLAEVSLTIGDVDGENLKAAGVEVTFNEVTLTRRVFRDGGSEYVHQQTACRLKDVQQLFMGTGVGRTSYSIMAQGNITQILSSKPEDRRMVFEEAAGITRFKSQKKEATRKLEYTDQNLLRIADLIREVKRQIGSLQRQAGKARRYKQFMLELQHLDTQLARHQFDVLQAEIAGQEAAVTQLRNDIELHSDNVLRGENEITLLRERLSELEQEISQAQHQGLDLKNQMDRHENRIHFNEERLQELQNQNARALSDIAQAEERRLAAEQELAVVADSLARSQTSLEEHKQALSERRQALVAVENSLRAQQEAMRQAQTDAFAAAQQLSRVRNEITSLDLLQQGNVVRLEKLSAEKIQLEAERAGLEQRLQEFSANVEADQLDVEARRGTVEERQQKTRELQEQLRRLGAVTDELLQRQAENRSRLVVLEQLQAGHEGFGAGALAALQKSEHVLGSLADKIRVPDQYITAIETALGHHLQLVLTEEPGTAQQILADLGSAKKGRASIAALKFQAPGDAVRAEADSLLSFIEAEESVQPLLRRLLGTTKIVPDLAGATELWQQSNGQYDFVTLAGDLLSRHGVFTGGSNNGSSKTPASILGRKNQIAELRYKQSVLQEEVEESSRRKGELQGELTALQATLQQDQTELRMQEVAIATRQGEVSALQNSQRVLHQKIDTVVYQVQSLASQEKETIQKRAGLTSRVGDLEASEQGLQQKLSGFVSSLEALRLKRDASTASLTEAKVSLATEEQLCASFGNQKRPLEQRLVEMRHLVNQRRGEIESFLNRKSQAEVEIQESRVQIESLQHAREQINTAISALVAQKTSQEEETSTKEEHLREQRRHLTEAQEKRSKLDVELAQKNMAVQNICERIQQKYQLKLEDVRSECITITFADEGPAKVQTLTPEEMAASGVATDWNAVTEQVQSLQKRIDEIGPVNLVAIEEYEETEQRHQFLSTQYDDLVKAKEQLLEVISRINIQTKEMFGETFARIRENFRILFTEIFGGGKADLLLVNEGDVLESGIDIMARPPGKQLQSISLLSGGEQTMTAVALLFAIYQVKPSPFCVLDELDAPLDESNINRFIRVLQRFLQHSQFVIITHNKRTIGIADVLYGVTMQEQGVSKIVSVKFHKAEEIVIDHKPEPLVPPAPGASIEQEEDALHETSDTLELAMDK